MSVLSRVLPAQAIVAIDTWRSTQSEQKGGLPGNTETSVLTDESASASKLTGEERQKAYGVEEEDLVFEVIVDPAADTKANDLVKLKGGPYDGTFLEVRAINEGVFGFARSLGCKESERRP